MGATNTMPRIWPRWVIFCWLLVALVLLSNVVDARARGRKNRKGQAASRGNDRNYRELYSKCETDYSKCGSVQPDSMKPPCILKCMSPACYSEVYGADELEEGELDFKRRREFKTCVRNKEFEKEKEATKKKQS